MSQRKNVIVLSEHSHWHRRLFPRSVKSLRTHPPFIVNSNMIYTPLFRVQSLVVYSFFSPPFFRRRTLHSRRKMEETKLKVYNEVSVYYDVRLTGMYSNTFFLFTKYTNHCKAYKRPLHDKSGIHQK